MSIESLKPVTTADDPHHTRLPFGSDLPPRLVPRGYQLELFQRACKENIITSLETGSGKTLVAALLIKKTIEDLEETNDHHTGTAKYTRELANGKEHHKQVVEDEEDNECDGRNESDIEDYESMLDIDHTSDDPQDFMDANTETSDEEYNSKSGLEDDLMNIDSEVEQVLPNASDTNEIQDKSKHVEDALFERNTSGKTSSSDYGKVNEDSRLLPPILKPQVCDHDAVEVPGSQPQASSCPPSYSIAKEPQGPQYPHSALLSSSNPRETMKNIQYSSGNLSNTNICSLVDLQSPGKYRGPNEHQVNSLDHPRIVPEKEMEAWCDKPESRANSDKKLRGGDDTLDSFSAPVQLTSPAQDHRESSSSPGSLQARAAAMPKQKIAVFLVHRVPLVLQQAKVIQSVMKSHVHVGLYHGKKGCDDWTSSQWMSSLRTKRVLVMTAQVFLNLLRHGLVDIRSVALLVLDEVHHATKNHPYRRLFLEFYHTLPPGEARPRVFGMTATPVKAKAACQQSDPCLKAILALEATLDATVVTVSSEARSEVEVLVPKPEEFIAVFEESDMHLKLKDDEIAEFETPLVASVLEIVSSSLLHPANAIQNEEKDTRISGQTPKTKEGNLETEEENILQYLLWKLGFQAAAYFAKQLCDVKGICSGDAVEGLLRKSSERDIKRGGVTCRISLLLDILFSECMKCRQEFEQSSDPAEVRETFRCIVFVKERVTAVVLRWLINTVFKNLDSAELNAKSAIGVQNSVSRIRMSAAKLAETLDGFRQGQFGILVATNVVEEGLDVPACRLVVVFDATMSPSAYVQSRGRARRRGARYINFLDRGSEDAHVEILRARQGAEMMSLLVSSEKAQDCTNLLYREALMKDALSSENKLYSKETRAQVAGTEAVSLLHRYVVAKAVAMGLSESLRPEYVFSRTSTGAYNCQVNLPVGTSVKNGFSLTPQETEMNAKRSAALHAYSKLYEVGEVDEFLLPKRTAKSTARRISKNPIKPGVHLHLRQTRRRSDREEQTKSAKRDRRVRKCRIAHPNALQSSLEGTANKLFSSEENSQQNTSRGANLGIVTQAEHVVCSESMKAEHFHHQAHYATASLNEARHNEKQMLLFSVQVDEDIQDLDLDNARSAPKFGILVENYIPKEDWRSIRCPSGQDLISLSFEKKVTWCNEMQDTAYKYVRSLQLCLRGRAPGSAGAIDLFKDDYCKDKNTGFLLVPLRKCENTLNFDIDWPAIEKLLCFGWRCGPLEYPDYEQHLKEGLEHSLMCSSHENFGRVYLSGEIRKDLRVSSSAKGFLNPTFETFADYFLSRHKTPIKNKEQNLVEGYIVLDKLCRLSLSPFMLPPELCRIIPIPPMACYIASILPQWQTFLALRSCWRRNRISPDEQGFLSFARALQPNINNIAKEDVDLCHERLEFLGDAVLKVLFSMTSFVLNPLDNEGFLSDVRDFEVSNQKLADLAMEMKIQDCVAFSGVSQKAKSWPWFWGTSQNKPISISQKVLADCVEALIGAHYLQGGLEAAAVFMDKHEVLPGACRVLGISESGGESDGALIKVPNLVALDDREHSIFIKEVESIIGYRFRNRGHLVVALTHGSFRNGNCPSYQRYEYLGDAIIGFLLLSHLFDEYTDLSPGELTALRGPALSNDLFARVIVSLKIHKRFWFECAPLEVEMEKFANLLENEKGDEDVCKTMTVPKVLGDLLEAIVGAMVIDNGMKLDGVKNVVLSLMDKELRRFCDPEKFKHNPVSELVHYVQRVHNLRPTYKYYDNDINAATECAVVVNNREIFRGRGPTRRLAKHTAAVESLRVLRKEQNGGGRILTKYDADI